MRPSEVEQLDPNEVFGALALQPHRRARPVLIDKARRTRPELVGQSTRIRQVFALIEKLGKARWPVLLVGEPGTGKEVVARAIHGKGRKDPFVVIDCPSIAGPLVESELFGQVEGAFAGATRKIGLIERANSGTAFFDSIDALPLDLQAKLLHVLQEKEFRPLGSAANRRSDFRLITATTRDLANEVEAGTFRKDLFYRLNVVNLRLPPLRERNDDIPALVSHFLARLGGNFTVTGEAMAVLLLYDWPANVRELESCIQHAAAVSTGELIDTKDLPPNLQNFLTRIQGTFLSSQTKQPKPVDSLKLERVNDQIPRSLWAHALNTFGSSALAMEWFFAECGALHNRPPIDAIRDEDGKQEVDRILGCIDYGMIA